MKRPYESHMDTAGLEGVATDGQKNPLGVWLEREGEVHAEHVGYQDLNLFF